MVCLNWTALAATKVAVPHQMNHTYTERRATRRKIEEEKRKEKKKKKNVDDKETKSVEMYDFSCRACVLYSTWNVSTFTLVSTKLHKTEKSTSRELLFLLSSLHMFRIKVGNRYLTPVWVSKEYHIFFLSCCSFRFRFSWNAVLVCMIGRSRVLVSGSLARCLRHMNGRRERKWMWIVCLCYDIMK